MATVGGQSINSVLRSRTCRSSEISTVVTIAFLLGENSPSELVDLFRGPFHVADTVVAIAEATKIISDRSINQSTYKYLEGLTFIVLHSHRRPKLDKKNVLRQPHNSTFPTTL